MFIAMETVVLKAEEFEGMRWKDRGFEEPHGEFQNLRRLPPRSGNSSNGLVRRKPSARAGNRRI